GRRCANHWLLGVEPLRQLRVGGRLQLPLRPDLCGLPHPAADREGFRLVVPGRDRLGWRVPVRAPRQDKHKGAAHCAVKRSGRPLCLSRALPENRWFICPYKPSAHFCTDFAHRNRWIADARNSMGAKYAEEIKTKNNV